MELKGSKTEKNLLTAFAGESQVETATPISHQLRIRKATSKFRLFLRKQQIRKKNTPKDCLSFSKAAK